MSSGSFSLVCLLAIGCVSGFALVPQRSFLGGCVASIRQTRAPMGLTMLFGGGNKKDESSGAGAGAPGGGFPNLGNTMEYMKAAQELRSKLAETQKELEETEVEGTASGGKIKVVMNGSQKPLRVELSDDFLNGSIEKAEAEKAILEAVDTALEKSRKLLSDSAMNVLSKGPGGLGA